MFRPLLLSLLLTSPIAAFHDARADTRLSGRVVGVSDGDTLTLLTGDNRSVKIRLSGIDAPEKRQPYGQKSKQALSDMVYSRDVTVRVEGIDRYGRALGSVRYSGRDVNRIMVERGYAWAYRRYLPANSPLLTVEQRARGQQTGLWALPEEQRVPPWQWRRRKTGSDQRRAKAEATSLSADCGSKRFCRQMSSCSEANHYLRHCGLTRLDGDGDGIPCESLCRP